MQIISETVFKKHYTLPSFADNAIEKFNLKFPMKPNADLAKITSFLTFDGHLTEDNKMFLFTGKTPESLREISSVTERQFKISGKLKKVATNKFGTSYEYRFCCKPIGKILEILGVPKGSKVFKEFSVPHWVMKNREFSYNYIRIAFVCEGSLWKERKRTQIAFKIHKGKDLITNGEKFLDDLRKILLKFGIKTTNTWTVKGNRRKDGRITEGIQFRIKSESIDDFLSYFNFNKRGLSCYDVGQTKVCAKS